VEAGDWHTIVWTDEGELFTFGCGGHGRLGHGGEEDEDAEDEENDELVPRLVEALVGEKLIAAAASTRHTVVWTDTGELFTFGNGNYGQLSHGGT